MISKLAFLASEEFENHVNCFFCFQDGFELQRELFVMADSLQIFDELFVRRARQDVVFDCLRYVALFTQTCWMAVDPVQDVVESAVIES